MYIQTKENGRKPAAAVAQLVEREKTGLGKDLNSNPYHLFSGVVAGSTPVSAAAFQRVPKFTGYECASALVQMQPYCGKSRVYTYEYAARSITSLEKDFYSNQNIQGGMRRFESCPGKAV